MTDWLTYEWEWHNQQATFKVDLQYWDLLPILSYSHLIYVSCAPKDASAEAFSWSEDHHLAALRHSLNTQLEGHAVYVGSIRLKNVEQLYYYTSDAALINKVSAICRSESRLETIYGQNLEPHYITYYKLLFPDDARLQSVENQAYIDQVIRRGGDTALVRRIELVMAFLTPSDREAFAKAIGQSGFTVGQSSQADTGSHRYKLSIFGYSSLKIEVLNRFTAHAIRPAIPYDGLLETLNAPFIRM